MHVRRPGVCNAGICALLPVVFTVSVFFAIFVCRQTVSVGQFGASVLPVAPAVVIPVGHSLHVYSDDALRGKVYGEADE